MSEERGLLPSNALSGIRLGISVSESPDLLRLGLLETHFRLAVGEIGRCVLVSGGHLAYGGHLQPTGYTPFLIKELERYSRRDRPLRVCLAWHEHRKITLSDLRKEIQAIGLNGEIVCLDMDGNPIDPMLGRTEAPPPPLDRMREQQSLSALRRYMTSATQGRVLIGGKRQDFQGELPGLLEEALLAFERQQPVYLAGGFGGIAWDIARELKIETADWFPAAANAPALDTRLLRGIARLIEVAKATGSKSLENGLTAEENRRLAVCHRPSEISALVSLGFGRRFERR